jgi:hypothetical protein
MTGTCSKSPISGTRTSVVAATKTASVLRPAIR